LLALVAATSALHFYLDANEKRCFIEELPTDTVVEGAMKPPLPRGRVSIFMQVTIVHWNGMLRLKHMHPMANWASK